MPFHTSTLPSVANFIPEDDKIFKSSINGFKIESIRLFFIVVDLATARRNMDFKLDLSSGLNIPESEKNATQLVLF